MIIFYIHIILMQPIGVLVWLYYHSSVKDRVPSCQRSFLRVRVHGQRGSGWCSLFTVTHTLFSLHQGWNLLYLWFSKVGWFSAIFTVRNELTFKVVEVLNSTKFTGKIIKKTGALTDISSLPFFFHLGTPKFHLVTYRVMRSSTGTMGT